MVDPRPARRPQVTVFTPALWSHQYSASDLDATCGISGDDEWYSPIGGPYGGLARGLYEGSTLVNGTLEARDAERAAATACGVNVVSPNYLQPRDMAAFVWSWAPGEPSNSSACVAQRPSDGRWVAVACDVSTSRACRREDDDLTWTLGSPSCPAGVVDAAPTNGRANARLRHFANGTLVRINVSASVLAAARGGGVAS